MIPQLQAGGASVAARARACCIRLIKTHERKVEKDPQSLPRKLTRNLHTKCILDTVRIPKVPR